MKKIVLLLIVSTAIFLSGCVDDPTEATVRFTCVSDNPYELFIDNDYKITLDGHTYVEYDLSEGAHSYYVEQVSGYLLYATTGGGNFTVVGGEDIEFTFPN